LEDVFSKLKDMINAEIIKKERYGKQQLLIQSVLKKRIASFLELNLKKK